MPTPKNIFSVSEINEQLANLEMINYVIYDGYSYQLNFMEYSNRIADIDNELFESQMNYNNGNITLEELSVVKQKHKDEINTILIVDEDDAICGKYFIDTRECELLYKRFVVNGLNYYYDINYNVYTKDDTYVGYLTNDLQFIDERPDFDDVMEEYWFDEFILY